MKIWQYLLAGVVAVLVLLSLGFQYVEYVNQTHPAPWPMIQGDSGGSFSTGARFPTERPEVLWSFPLADRPITGLWPLIGEGDTVYVAGARKLTALDANGGLRWTWNSTSLIASMALGRHGEIYVLEEDGLTALDSQGRRVWRKETPNGRRGAPLIVGQGGVLYIWSDRLYAVSDTGVVKWQSSVQATELPVETRSGHLVYTDGHNVYALNPDGEVAWSQFFHERLASLAADDDGQLYVMTDASFVVLDEEGRTKADVQAQGGRLLNLAVGADVVQRGLTRWSSAAEQVWSKNAPGLAAFTYLDADGNLLLFHAGDRGQSGPIVMLDPQGEEVWNLEPLRAASLPAIGSDGRICFIGRGLAQEEWSLICMGDRQAE